MTCSRHPSTHPGAARHRTPLVHGVASLHDPTAAGG